MAIAAERTSESPEPGKQPNLRVIQTTTKKADIEQGIDLSRYSTQRLAAALDGLGISNRWELANNVRNYARLPKDEREQALPRHQRLPDTNRAFQNLIVGRIAERLFVDICLRPLAEHGFEWQDDRSFGNSRDFTLTKEGSELPLNVKVATTRYLKAQSAVALAPEDCVPFPAHKVTNALKRLPDLLYVDLIDFGLRDKVENFMKKLNEDELIVWSMLTWYGGQGVTVAQDEFVNKLFTKHHKGLMKLAQDPPVFRAVSAKRIIQVLTDDFERCPQLTGKASLNGYRDATINLSISSETVPWSEVLGELTANGIDSVLQSIRKTGPVTRATPGL